MISSFRTLLALGRVSNLSTVWSNALCAWLIVDGSDSIRLIVLIAALSLVYLGGMFLNDACDARYDRLHKAERPIPAGEISRGAVLAWAIALLLIGAVLGIAAAPAAWLWMMLLLALIVAYDLMHKRIRWAPLIMAGCRAVLFPLVATATGAELSAAIAAAAAAQFTYICGLTYLSKREDDAKPSLSPIGVALLIGLFLALAFSPPFFGKPAAWIALTISVAWTAYSIASKRTARGWQVGRSIGLLLAGIPLLDLALAQGLAQPDPSSILSMSVFFLLALAAQRLIPAT